MLKKCTYSWIKISGCRTVKVTESYSDPGTHTIDSQVHILQIDVDNKQYYPLK